VSEEDARAVCERLRRTTEQSRVAVVGLAGESASIQITLSIGGAVYPRDGSSSPALWRAANAALLEAKRTGKNRVIFASSMEPETGGNLPSGPEA
jgi:GGDEF domain-containing protein